jgi:AcrR family transcriptional regulator
MSESPRRRERKGEGKRQALLDAAAAVISREGVNAATTRRIADEANVPLGTVHYWFAGKDELLEEVVTTMIGKLSDAVDEVGEQHRPSDTALLDAFRAAWRVVEQDEPGAQLALFELTALSVRTPAMRDLARKQYALYWETAARTAGPWIDETSKTLPGGRDALAQLITAVFDGMSIAWLANPESAQPDDVFQVLAALIDGARDPEN